MITGAILADKLLVSKNIDLYIFW